MRLYHGATSPKAIRKARKAAPSHVHGACWTPTKMTPHEWPFFIDNGAFTGDFDAEEWLALLDEVPERMPFPPDFVVLPDELNDATETVARHREFVHEVVDRGLSPAPVLQPGLPIQAQIAVYSRISDEVRMLFVGGESRWQKANGVEIVETAHDHGLRVHIGNPGGKEELCWWAKVGVDSMDTSSVVRNDNWGWLRALEDLKEGAVKKGGRQGTLPGVAD